MSELTKGLQAHIDKINQAAKELEEQLEQKKKEVEKLKKLDETAYNLGYEDGFKAGQEAKKGKTGKAKTASEATPSELSAHSKKLLAFIKTPKMASEIKEHMKDGLDGSRIAPILRALRKDGKLKVLGGKNAGAGRKYQAV